MNSITLPNRYQLREYAKDSWYNTRQIFAPVVLSFLGAGAIGSCLVSLENPEPTPVVREASSHAPSSRIGVVIRDTFANNSQIAEVKIHDATTWVKFECNDGSLVRTVDTSPYLLAAPFAPPDVITVSSEACANNKITAEDDIFPVGDLINLSQS